MFKYLRLRLVLAYVGLSTVVYLLLIGMAVSLFYAGLTRALDQELTDVATEILPTIEVDEAKGQPTLGALPSKLESKPIRLLVSIALFDKEGALLTHLGSPGLLIFKKNSGEMTGNNLQVRFLTTPLYDEKDNLIGYLIVELPTATRANSTRQFALALLATAPFLLIAMSLAGYFYSSMATRPIESSYMLLKSFLHDANHELKTPIAIAQATVENLQRDLEEMEGDPHKERLETLKRSIDRMQKLTADMLYLAQAESGNINKEYVDINPAVLLPIVIADFRPLYATKGVALTVAGIAEAHFPGNIDEFQRVFANLLDNALRHTPSGGCVKVAGALRGKSIVLTVEDNGQGIPKDSLPLIFERFYRVDKGRDRRSGGSGLGLAIVKAIVDGMGGTIEFTSEEGKGTLVTIVI